MGELEGGAEYVPGYRQEGRSVAGPDEDSFTMAATALEQLGGGGSPPPTIHFVGGFAPVLEWGIAALLSHPVHVVRHAPGRAGFDEAWDQLVRPDAGGGLLVIVELPERGSVGAAPPSSEGAVAFALRFRAGAPTPETVLPSEGGAGALARKLLAHLPPGSVRGSAAPPSRPARPPLQTETFLDTPTAVLSEGAYVPRARYLENLPSRWRLEGVRCARCGGLTFPSRTACRTCGAETGLAPEALSRDGAVVMAATTIGRGGQPTEFDAQVDALGEYSVVLAEFAPGVRLTLQVTDAAPGEIRIGDRIGTRLRRLYPMEGEWRYGRKAVPLPAAGARITAP